MVEFHKKFAIPFACIVFVILGVPMAVTTSRSGKGISVSLALAVYFLYYLFLMGGEKLSDRGKLDPFMAMWTANFVLLALGIPLFVRAMKEGPLWRPRSEEPDVSPDPDSNLTPARHGAP